MAKHAHDTLHGGVKQMRTLKNTSGFTLIELIIVVAVTAVLIGIIAPQFLKYVEKSKRAVDLQHARTMVEVYDEILATEDVKMINGYGYMQFWNVEQAEFYDYKLYASHSDILYRVFARMGGVPVSRVNKDYFFTVFYSADGIWEIYLDELPYEMKTKLYPDDGSFYNNGFKN